MPRGSLALPDFPYHTTPSPDGFFGVETTNGSWNGMIGELLNKVRSKKKTNKQTLPDRGALEVPHFSLKLSLRMHTKRCMETSFFLLTTILKWGAQKSATDPRDTKDKNNYLTVVLEGTKKITQTSWEVRSSYSMNVNPFNENYKLNKLWLIFDSI